MASYVDPQKAFTVILLQDQSFVTINVIFSLEITFKSSELLQPFLWDQHATVADPKSTTSQFFSLSWGLQEKTAKYVGALCKLLIPEGCDCPES